MRFRITMLMGILLALAAVSGATEETPLLAHSPTASKTQVAFAYGGYLWSVPRDGGDPKRLTGHPAAEVAVGSQVSRFGSPPSDGMTNTSTFPSYWPVNAIHFPSGENTGNRSCPPVVNCRASPPSRGTLQR